MGQLLTVQYIFQMDKLSQFYFFHFFKNIKLASDFVVVVVVVYFLIQIHST